MLRLSFCDVNLFVICLAIVIHLVFCVSGCVMTICLAVRDCECLFWLAVVNFPRNCDWLVFCHAIVICLALRNGDLLVDWNDCYSLLSCDCSLSVLSAAIVICLLL